MAFNTFNVDHHVVKTIDKKAYLSALAISNYIVVTCDSTSMISEAAMTGKPVYIAMMKSFKPCLLYTSPSPRDKRQSRMPSSA